MSHPASGKDAVLAHSDTLEGGSVPVQNSLHRQSLAIWGIIKALPHIFLISKPVPIWSIYVLINRETALQLHSTTFTFPPFSDMVLQHYLASSMGAVSHIPPYPFDRYL